MRSHVTKQAPLIPGGADMFLFGTATNSRGKRASASRLSNYQIHSGTVGERL